MTSSNNQEHKHDQLSEETVEDASTPGNVVSLAPSPSEHQPVDDRLSPLSVEHALGDAQNVDIIPSSVDLLLEQNRQEQEIKPLSPSLSVIAAKDRSDYPPLPIQSDEQAQKEVMLQPVSPSKDTPKALGYSIVPKRPQGSIADADLDKTVRRVQSSGEEKSANNRVSVQLQEVREERKETPIPVSIQLQEVREERKETPIPVSIQLQEVREERQEAVAKEHVPVYKQETREEKKGTPIQETPPKTGVALQEQEAREALIEDLLALDQSVTSIAEDDDQSPTPYKEVQSASLIETVVLYRGQHFYVRTTVRPEKRRYSHPLRKPTGHTAMVPKIVPDQKDRVAASETRLMPAIDLKDLMPRKRRLPLPPWLEIAWVTLGVIISVIAHAYNMFNYPRYEMDEGTYMSSAWAILNGKLYPYAYGYGHPPFAWMQLAGLVQLAGGFFLFGNAINTGRVLMLFYTAGSTLLVYLIAHKLSGSRSMALLAMVLSALSPLAVTYQRLVMLDNIASFWFLLSLYFLVISRSQLRYTILSAICFGLSMLSKEVLILFMPAMLYGVWLYTTGFQRKFAFVAFIYTFAAIGSLYVLLAVLKGELFPPGVLPWDKHQHLSLLGTLLDQTSRGQSEGPLSLGWQAWYGADPLFMVLGLVAIAFNVAVGWWKRNHLFLAILAISYWILLIRGGVVFPFYFIPLIPMMAMNSAIMIHALADWMGRYVRLDLFRAMLILGILGVVLVFDAVTSGPVYNGNLTQVQTQAIAWVGANVPRDSYIIMNSYMYMDLKAPGGAAVGTGSVFPNAEVYINIATDPVLLAEVNNNWDRVDYIVADSQIEEYITSKSTKLPTGAAFMLQALKAAGYPNSPCATFKAPGYEMHVWCVKHRDLKPVASTLPANQSPIAVSAELPVETRTHLG
jgi:4-amino-4-deoxy-L-arabinose transferase-like glycosyltransferase